MAIAAAVVIVPLGVLFFLSGLVVNFIQAICFVLVRPLSKSLYRRINRVVAELLWLELVWLIDWWAGVQIKLFADTESFQIMGKEHALVISNHKSDIDWLVGWVLAQRFGCLGSSLAVMKKSSKFLPVIGWSMWFSEYLFLERSWAKDETTLKSGLQRLRDYPQPFWLALFVEGTRFTQAKLLAAQEYAASTGLPVPRNVLIPRTKGFVSAVSNMRPFVPAVYDFTVAIPKSSPPPTMLRLFRGQPSVHTSLSPDGKLRIIVGDNPEGMLVDSGTGKMVASLVGHLDFFFTSAWHPDGLTFVTGNQDKTCRIWDARNLSKSVAALKGNFGAIQSIRYSSDGRFMAMAEPADFVHVFDAKSGYEKEQEIDFFGEISGMSFSPDTESLFIGVCDAIGVWERSYDGLLEFDRRRNNSCPNSII